MAPTKEQIREKYLSNEIFLIGEKLAEGLEVIDRRANYIVVVNDKGEDRKMFLDEAYAIKFPEPTPEVVVEETEGHQHPHSIDVRPNGEGCHCVVCRPLERPCGCTGCETITRATRDLNNLNSDASDEERNEAESALRRARLGLKEEKKPTRWSKLSTKFSEPAYTFKGYRATNFNKFPQIQPIFMEIAEQSEDPYAVLTAIKQLDIFLEKRDAASFERVKTAIAKIDDLDNHKYLTEDLIVNQVTTPALSSFKEFDLGEEFDFPIEEKMTYSGFKSILTEDFHEHAEHVITNLEKNPKELDSLTHHVRTIEDIAHHYDHHSVHMESAEHAIIKTIERTKPISLRKLSSGPQLIKIAKRAAVSLIAERMANKPIKKISHKEKDVLLSLIKKKKTVVFKLAKKLIPKIIAIEHHHHESHAEGHKEFGSGGS